MKYSACQYWLFRKHHMNDKPPTIYQRTTAEGIVYECAKVLLREGTSVEGSTVMLHRISPQQLKEAREKILKEQTNKAPLAKE